MNPVLVILILVGGFILWLMLSFLYKFVGRISGKLIDDAKRAMFEDDEENKNKIKNLSKEERCTSCQKERK